MSRWSLYLYGIFVISALLSGFIPFMAPIALVTGTIWGLIFALLVVGFWVCATIVVMRSMKNLVTDLRSKGLRQTLQERRESIEAMRRNAKILARCMIGISGLVGLTWLGRNTIGTDSDGQQLGPWWAL